MRAGDVASCVLCLPCILFSLPSRLRDYRIEKKRREEEEKERKWKSQVHIGNDIISDDYGPFEDVEAPCQKGSQIKIQDLVSLQGYLHYDNYEDLHRSSLDGCKLCAVLLLAMERNPANRRLKSWIHFKSIGGQRPTLKLISSPADNGVKSDLLELRLVTRLDTESFVLKDAQAKIGLYVYEGV